MFLTEEWDVITQREVQQAATEQRNPKSERLIKKGGLFNEEPLDPFEPPTFVHSPIALSPYKGYAFAGKQWSLDSILWVEHQQGIDIQHSLNGGEKQVYVQGHTYSLDGYYKDQTTQQEVAFDFLGCYWHSCPKCYGKHLEDEIFDDEREGHHSTMNHDPCIHHSINQRYKLYLKRHHDLQAAGFKGVEMWEHEFQYRKTQDAALKQFCASQEVVSRLDPQDAFFGGRTNAACLYHQVQGQEKIHYQDVTRLYPIVLKYDIFPVGHSKIITSDFAPLSEYFDLKYYHHGDCFILFLPIVVVRSSCFLCVRDVLRTRVLHLVPVPQNNAA